MTDIEIVRDIPRGRFRFVLFDFDGTLSLIREGWPSVMIPMMVEALRATGTTEDDTTLTAHVEDFVMRLNGRQTIYQMIQLADEVTQRGGQPLEPLAYKHEYHARLMRRIQGRLDALASSQVPPDDWTVPGSHAFLTRLQERGLNLYLASGTDVAFVKREVELLGLSKFFGAHIYGALDDYQNFSKKMIIDRILTENHIPGHQLLAFGDGYVEIENTKTVGGLAVAVASDEANNGSGNVDQWKRQRLLGVGADIVIPDFRDAVRLMDCILDRKGEI